MSVIREVKEGRQEQGVEERIAYTIATTPWGSSPTNVVIKAYDTVDLDVDVSATILDGSPVISGDGIQTPTVQALTLGHMYRVEVKFTSGGNIFEFFFMVKCER